MAEVSESSDEICVIPRVGIAVTKRELYVSVLRSFQKLGYDQPTYEQAQAVCKFAQGKDVLVILPTGGGKSLCFVALPHVFDYLKQAHAPSEGSSVVVVVSPLVSLMKDQVRSYSKRGLRCAFIGDESGDEAVKQAVVRGSCQVVYASPESLLTVQHWRDMLASPVYASNLVALVVDEAHCIDTWGLDFRTEYGCIAEIRSIVPKNINVMALTATASTSNKKVIMQKLCIEEDKCAVIEKLPNKPNIKFVVQTALDSIEQMLLPLVLDIQTHGKATNKTILFCKTYNDLTEVATSLVSELHSRDCLLVDTSDGTRRPICEMYSASTAEDAKDDILQEFTDADSHIRVVIATIAFGMGLDARDVRRSIHWGPSDTIQAYVQESGRCGRDGMDSVSLLYVRKSDVSKRSITSDTMKLYCTNTDFCRRKLLMKEFDVPDTVTCPIPLHKCCDICEQECMCSKCKSDVFFTESEISQIVDISQDESLTLDARCPIKESKKAKKCPELRKQLLDYRNSMCQVTDQHGHKIPLLFGVEITSGIPDATIEAIIENRDSIQCTADVVSMGVVCESHACHIYHILKSLSH